MATQTRRIGTADNGNVLWEYDYDDVTLNVTALRCANNSARAARSTVWRLADPSVSYTRLHPAGQADTLSIPTGQATRLQLTLVQTPHGPVLDGMDGRFDWPV